MKKEFKWIWYALWLIIALVGGGGTLFSWMPRTAGMFYGGCAMLIVAFILGLTLLLVTREKSWKQAFKTGFIGGAVYTVILALIVFLCDNIIFVNTVTKYEPVHSSLIVVVLNFWLMIALCVLVPKKYDAKLTWLKRAMAAVLCIVALVLSGMPQNFWWSVYEGDVAIKNWEPTDANFEKHTLNSEQVAFDEGEFVLGEYDIVVSPEGEIKTLAEAKEYLKSLKGVTDKTVTVWFKEGTYLMEEALAFDTSDLTNVVYRAMPNETVVFSGSQAISNWSEGEINGVKALVADADVTENYFHSLFKDGERLQVSTWPKEGHFKVADARVEDTFNQDSDGWKVYGAFYANTDEIKDFANLEDVYVRVSHKWVDDMMPLHSVDTATGRIETSRGSARDIVAGDAFVYENVRETLSEPGEWYLDRSEGKLYYIPKEGEDAANTVVYAPVTAQLLSFDGAEDIQFQGITFTETDWEFYDGAGPGYGNTEQPLYQNMKYQPNAYQANLGAPSTITVKNSSGINFVDCEMTNISFTGIHYAENTADSKVEACLFDHVGGSSVVIGIDNMEVVSPKNIQVVDNHVRYYGRVFNQSVGVHLIFGNDCVIANNEVHDGYYSGMSIGWKWSYEEQPVSNIQVKDNLIYNIGVDSLLSDMGGIYTLGVQPGTVLSGNVIYNVKCYDYGACGIYMDAGSSEMIIENNIITDCATVCFTTSYGQNNVVRNNIFAYGNRWGSRIDKADDQEGECSILFENNIVVTNGAAVLPETNPQEWCKEQNNIFHDYTRDSFYCGESMRFWLRTSVEDMKANGYFLNDVLADPLFTDASNRDFTLTEESPAWELGFKEITSKAGTHYSFE